MKFSTFTLASASAFELSAVTPPPTCPDLDKFEICTSKCASELNSCKAACDPEDYSCQSRCDAFALDCNSSCPCGDYCPNGCSGCSNAACEVNEHVLIINHLQLYDNEAYLLNLATDTLSRARINGWSSLGTDTEDSCYSFMSGEHWFLGGYENPRMIAKLNIENCEVKPEQNFLPFSHLDGIWGSCASYNDVTYLCFDEDGVDVYGCSTFDGESQTVISAKSNYAHDWADMTVFDDKMWVVGGCDPEIYGCHGETESFDGNSWAVAAAHPSGAIASHLVLSDGYALYTISGRGGLQQDVFMFKNNVWTLLGKLTENHADASFLSSGRIVGEYAYLGENSLEKVKLSETDFSAINLGSGPDANLNLYYAAFIAVGGAVCSV
ncbi:unnamed protein product [Oikopleura dioica]|uniref:Uncharacterized protein n=1 Tax=Oikopleura dioica TaxID=34765 RepID=E4YFM0_OIKDI|nr:unnamed protein product [Oikopleura dioica]